MAFTIQTNVNSLIAQENLRVNNDFQSRTIQRLTSGFRINQSGDDAAGLSIANKFRADIAELTQGVRNANDGISTLQIVDGGLNNISKMLDRMKTLATQSASSTFSGDRSILNTEFSDLQDEITRQANNIGLVTSGENFKQLSVFVGGGDTQTNSCITVGLDSQAVDATSLLGASPTLTGGGSGTATTLTSAATLSTSGNLAGSSQKINVITNSGTKTIEIDGGTEGLTRAQVIDTLNQQLGGTGISAGLSATNTVTFSSDSGFVLDIKAAANGASGITTGAEVVENANQSSVKATFGGAAAANTLTFEITGSGATFTVSTAGSEDTDAVETLIRRQLEGSGIEVMRSGSDFYFQSKQAFTFAETGTEWADTAGAGSYTAATDPTAAAKAALLNIESAMTKIGTVQGTVGAAQNKLQYAIQLAQSQISSYSAAESRIRDADIASEAANLTKAQVLQQASMAAMAQANSAPQAVLALLRG